MQLVKDASVIEMRMKRIYIYIQCRSAELPLESQPSHHPETTNMVSTFSAIFPPAPPFTERDLGDQTGKVRRPINHASTLY